LGMVQVYMSGAADGEPNRAYEAQRPAGGKDGGGERRSWTLPFGKPIRLTLRVPFADPHSGPTSQDERVSYVASREGIGAFPLRGAASALAAPVHSTTPGRPSTSAAAASMRRGRASGRARSPSPP
jgi:hypothetical protein